MSWVTVKSLLLKDGTEIAMRVHPAVREPQQYT
jgi:hypothetical protein